MNLLSLCKLDKRDDYQAYVGFFEPPYGGGNIIQAEVVVHYLNIDDIEYVSVFDSINEAHKYAFIRSFGKEAYEAEY